MKPFYNRSLILFYFCYLVSNVGLIFANDLILSEVNDDEVTPQMESADSLSNLLENKPESKADSGKDQFTKHYRSYEELKKDFEEMNMNVKTDQEIIQGIMTKYLSNPSLEEKEILLEDLGYLLHQVDNAIMFADNNWLEILINDLQMNNFPTKLLVLDCLSAAMQGNPKVKVKAIESKAFIAISRLISEAWTDPSSQNHTMILSKSLSAMGILLRSFPAAQWKYFNQTRASTDNLPLAHSILLNILRLPADQKSFQKLQIKSISLINDMLREREEIVHHPEDAERIRQYNLVDFDKTLDKLGWCAQVRKHLLNLKLDQTLATQNSDFLGDWLISTSRILKHCPSNAAWFSENRQTLQTELVRFRAHFEELHSEDWDCQEILDSIDFLISHLKSNKDEL